MGRRDEPKLDELQRLLKRLEHMDVDTADAPTRETTPSAGSQGPGYVGALRGAPTTLESKDAHSYSQREPATAAVLPYSSDSARSSSTASAVIGATTAAVVSSMIVVGLLLWTQGREGDKDAGPQRLNFVAPAGPDVSPLGRAQPAAPVSAPDAVASPDTQNLLQRADQQIRNGRPSEARALLEAAAKLGSGVAALTLGAMYDPTRVAESGNLGVQADPTLARAWYERAKDLGVSEANDRLAELARK
jgi:hypothetical protein